MEKYLIRRFIKDPDNVNDPQVRSEYGFLSGVSGIFCNLFLFFVKIFTGIFSGSVSICSDAFNNLSDCANCIVTLLGCRMASKPADKTHPYGHGRAEYLTSLVISVAIFSMGLELLKNSAEKIFSPVSVEMNIAVVAILLVSIFIKFRMYRFNTILGEKINSQVLLATAEDSRNDAFSTSATLISVILSHFFSLPFDGIAGAFVSIMIVKSGFDIIRTTVDDILGKAVSPEIISQIREIVCSDEKVLGVHDIMIHTYGPAKIVGSCHAEFDSSESFVSVHEHTDHIERQIKKELNIDISIHMDPVATDDEMTEYCRKILEDVLAETDSRLSFHDLRLVSHGAENVLIFDLSVPDDIKCSEKELHSIIENAIAENGINCGISVTFDRVF